MWIFDEDKDINNDELLGYVEEGNDDAVRHFPKKILNNSEKMLFLVKQGYDYLVLKNCSESLKNDVQFLKEVAQILPYFEQESFLNQLPKEIQNNKEILDIFAAKADISYVKETFDIKDQLDKTLKQTTTHNTKINKI